MRLDSSEIIEYVVKDTMDDYYHAEPTLYYDRERNLIKTVVASYTYDDPDSEVLFDIVGLRYYEIDLSDIEDIKVVKSFDVSDMLHHLDSHPGSIDTWLTVADNSIMVKGYHYTDGRQGMWLAWYDNEGNFLGGHDHAEAEGLVNGRLYSDFTYGDRYVGFFDINNDLNNIHFMEMAPDFPPRLLKTMTSENYYISRGDFVYFDEASHQIILATSLAQEGEITNEVLVEYLGVFDARDIFLYPTSVKSPEVLRYNIYPNPANSYLKIELPEATFNGKVKLIDAQGKLAMEKPANFTHSTYVDISALLPGVYSLMLQDEDAVYEIKRMVKL